jgi:1-deoxy-D-xylulose-5-phosphate synthase
MNETDLRDLMYSAQLRNNGPFAIRYPRGKGITANWNRPFTEIEIGRARCVRKGKDVAVLTIGYAGVLASEAIKKLTAQDNIEVEHWDMRFVKPLDEECLHDIFKRFEKIITVEDGVITGGFGSAIIEFMADHGYNANVVRLGVPDRFIEHGTQQELFRECGFDSESIFSTILKIAKPRLLSRIA